MPTVVPPGLAHPPTASDGRLDRDALPDDIRHLSQLSPGRSLAAVAAQWLMIVGVAAPAVLYRHWSQYAVAVIVIATRQHALGVLVHEATHFRLFPNRAMNDTLADLFCALPLGISTSVYRHNHLRHHPYVNTENDPDARSVRDDADWLWPKLWGGALLCSCGMSPASTTGRSDGTS